MHGTGTAKHLDRRRTTTERFRLRNVAHSSGRHFSASRRVAAPSARRPRTHRTARGRTPHLRARTFPVRAAEPGGAPSPSRVFERPVCGRPGLLRRQQAQKCDLAHFRTPAGGARWPAFAPRMHRAFQLRVRVSRRFAPSVAERSTLPRRAFPAGSFRFESCGGLCWCHHLGAVGCPVSVGPPARRSPPSLAFRAAVVALP